MFGNDRNAMRQYYVDVWAKAQNKLPLEPLEKIIAAVISQHPEYHQVLTDKDDAIGKEYSPEMGETNPFMHMGMHIGIHEQLSMNQPTGIRDIYQQLTTQLGDEHKAEHKMMDCLGEMMWQAQHQGTAPDEAQYLDCLKKITN